MKKLLITSIFFCYLIVSFSQNDTIQELETAFIAEPISPSFPGGEEKMKSFIQLVQHYPDSAKTNELEGRVYIQFNVSKTGELSNFKPFRSPYSLLNQEAIRILKLMPKWIPGTNYYGNTSDTRMVLPFNFKINTDSIYFNPETSPTFSEGYESLIKFLTYDRELPQVLYEKSGTFRYYFHFVIEKDGSITNFKMIRKYNEGVYKHYINIFMAMPKWNPGKMENKIVRTEMILPVKIHWK